MCLDIALNICLICSMKCIKDIYMHYMLAVAVVRFP